ncbi:MAG: hypothetical protein ABW196_01150 [Solirubrobacterales bacterium]
MNAWLKKTQALCEYVAVGEADDREPLCFVLGAGDSLSSGAPTTKALIRRFNKLTDGRFGAEPENRRGAIERINEDEKRRAIKDLFRDVRPYIGYRCLAAMGFTRRIYVFTLNWDTALDQACREAGVLLASVSLDEGPEALACALEGEGPGVVIIHAHGQWDKDHPLRWGTLETLSIDDECQRLLAERVFRHATAVIGASLSGDLDLQELIEKLSAEELPPIETRPLWLLAREASTGLSGANVAAWMQSRRSAFNEVVDPSVDFDTAMAALRAAQAGLPFSQVQRKASHLDLPDWEEIVWPRPELLRPLLDARAIAFVGEPKLGKSTVAHLLAWLTALWQRDPQPPVSVYGPSSTMKALAVAGSPSSDAAPAALVLDDPFGDEHADPNPDFISILEETDPASAPRIFICSRLANWREAGEDLPADLAQPACAPTKWYAERSLLAYLGDLGEDALERWEELVRTRELNTPSRVLAAAQSDFAPDADDPGNVGDKTRLLCKGLRDPKQRPAALIVLLARLQELSEEPKTRGELELAAGPIDQETSSWRALGSMLNDFDLDGVERIKLAHSTDRSAVDVVLREAAEEVRELLISLGPTGAWAVRAIDVFEAVDSLREGKLEQLWSLPEELRTAWGPSLIGPALAHSPTAAWDTIEWLYRDSPQDFWSCCELVYDVVRLWRDLTPDQPSAKRARVFLTDLLDNRALMGAYVLLEATLYHRSVDKKAIWWPLLTKITEMAGNGREHDFELGLIFDGLVWRSPAAEEDRDQLLEALFKAAEQADGLLGAYALACAYHSAGGAAVIEEYPELAAIWGRELSEPEAAQAARLIRFHFAHQSRARTMLARRPFEGGMVSYLSRTLYPERLDQGDLIVSLIEKISKYEDHAGWAVYTALNLSTTQGEFSRAQMSRISKCLPAAADDALIAGAITHERPRGIRQLLLKRLRASGVGETMLDRLRDGFPIDGWTVIPPRFCFVRDLTDAYDTFGIDWSELEKVAKVDTSDPRAFVLSYEAVADRAVELGAPEDAVKVLLERIRCGDRRDLLVAMPPARNEEDPYLYSLLFAAKTLSEQGELF